MQNFFYELLSVPKSDSEHNLPPERREKPDISLRIHASIRRQLKEGETDPIRMAFVALKDVLVPETH